MRPVQKSSQLNHVKITADLSSNHMGDIELAKEMIRRASEIGIDIVKVQSWQADKLTSTFRGNYKSTYNRHKKTELSDKDHYELIETCTKNGVQFLTTCFDLDRVDFLASLGLRMIKVGSPDCNSKTLLKKLMDNFETLIISTGMHTDEEIIDTIRFIGNHSCIMFHCVSLYPTPLEKCNLLRINWLREQGAKKVGFSDHSLGIEASMATMTMGIEMIEKHLTLDRNLPGKDQRMSTIPEEFARICSWRDLCAKMLGESSPQLSDEEREMREIYVGKWGNNR